MLAQVTYDDRGNCCRDFFAIEALMPIRRAPHLNYKFLFDGEE